MRHSKPTQDMVSRHEPDEREWHTTEKGSGTQQAKGVVLNKERERHALSTQGSRKGMAQQRGEEAARTSYAIVTGS